MKRCSQCIPRPQPIGQFLFGFYRIISAFFATLMFILLLSIFNFRLNVFINSSASVSLLTEFHRLEFRVFLFLDWLPNQGLRTQSVLLFTHNWRENR